MANPIIVILMIFGVISLICSLLTLGIIRLMKVWNDYIKLVFNLTSCQLVYDISIIMILNQSRANDRAFSFLRVVSGLAATLWTNVISFIVFYVVYYKRAYEISRQRFRVIFAAIFIPSLIEASLVASTDGSGKTFFYTSNIYYWIRIASILTNILFYIALYLYIYRSGKKDQMDSVVKLAFRMKYYPIVQVMTRLGAAWYEIKFGFGYSYDANGPSLDKFIGILYAFTLPSAGIGYFLIFVCITPDVRNFVEKKLRKLLGTKGPGNGFDTDDDRIVVHNHSDLSSGDISTKSFTNEFADHHDVKNALIKMTNNLPNNSNNNNPPNNHLGAVHHHRNHNSEMISITPHEPEP